VPGTRSCVTPNEVYADWEAVYRNNVGRVYGLMFTKVGNRPDAEDLTAEVFVAALRPLPLPAPAARVRAYLLAVSRTVLAHYWRRTLGLPVTALPGDLADEAGAAELESDAPRQAERILSVLPERYQRILHLRFIEAYSVAEAAKILGISVANAKVLQHRALRRAAEAAAGLEPG
jgi:RNA polymerase sigma factor (sigma-70 family)